MLQQFKIRFASLSDAPDIMSFIKTYWSENHILAKNFEFFNYQYTNNKKLNFVISLNENNSIVGILGFIEYFPAQSSQDIALALWKVQPNLSDPFLGIKLINFLNDELNPSNIHCVGISEDTIPIHKYLKFKTGKLDHFAAFNKNCKKFEISEPPEQIKATNTDYKFSFNPVKSLSKTLDKLASSDFYEEKVPKKSKEFFQKRYIDHPYFQYRFHEINTNNLFCGFVVSRELRVKSASVLRIIEVVCDDNNVSSVVNDFANILKNSDHEYIDVYASNLNKEILEQNYEDISNSDGLIVPDHFSPFSKKNIDILYSTTSKQDIHLFKGDGDQDRPNL